MDEFFRQKILRGQRRHQRGAGITPRFKFENHDAVPEKVRREHEHLRNLWRALVQPHRAVAGIERHDEEFPAQRFPNHQILPEQIAVDILVRPIEERDNRAGINGRLARAPAPIARQPAVNTARRADRDLVFARKTEGNL